jgi:DNA-binding LacI/PurR family transcriptional regulator
MVKIKDIASLAGVSPGVVSTVLNKLQNNIKVRPETRVKILDAARELNYIPNMNAKGLRMSRSFMIGVLSYGIVGSFIAEILQGIEDFFLQNEYSMLLLAYKNQEELQERIDLLRKKNIEGMIVISGGFVAPCIESMTIPTVIVGAATDISDAPISSVCVDSFKVGYLATEYLLKKGHKRIAMMDREYGDGTIGWRQAMVTAGLTPQDKWLVRCNTRFDDGRKSLDVLLKLGATAVIANGDRCAAGIIKAAIEKGIKVPEELSVMGIDNLEICEMLTPALTTIAQPQIEQGAMAAELLHDMLHNKSKSRNIVLEPYLIERESCKRYVKLE